MEWARDVDTRVREIAAEVAGRPVRAPDQPLDLDSLGQAELAFALEEAFGVRLSDDAPLRTPYEAAVAVGDALGATAGRDGDVKRGIGHLQWLGRDVLGAVLTRYYRFEVRGADRVPEAGPAVLASNHDSLLDIPFLVLASPRPVWFMAKRELYTGRFGAWFFHVLGGFPVLRQGPDLAAVRAALAVLDAGMLLGMYPEGTRSRDFLPFLPGAAWVALAAGAPLIPVAVRGTGDAMPRGSLRPRRVPVSVTFGEPLDLGRVDAPRRRLEEAAAATQALRAEVERLLRS
ncbi:MAG TPA: 1-acyl-sn-glycerol-3-phosphate acyltransferase [Actinomycetota bacterium]|nr:1-acyl-sn-glycerol-3-phosphate acyltransferase [Actinomycetota bacterium]